MDYVFLLLVIVVIGLLCAGCTYLGWWIGRVSGTSYVPLPKQKQIKQNKTTQESNIYDALEL